MFYVLNHSLIFKNVVPWWLLLAHDVEYISECICWIVNHSEMKIGICSYWKHFSENFCMAYIKLVKLDVHKYRENFDSTAHIKNITINTKLLNR